MEPWRAKTDTAENTEIPWVLSWVCVPRDLTGRWYGLEGPVSFEPALQENVVP